MQPAERTRDQFEDLPNCSRPPLIPVPDFDRMICAEISGVQYRQLPKWAIKAGWSMLGFKAFHKRLPAQLERLLQTPGGGALVPGPVQAATLALQDESGQMDPFERAAALLLGARSLYRDLLAGSFEPDRHRNQILDMSQYFNLFSTSLILDGARCRLFKSSSTSCITVAHAGTFYALTVGDASLPLSMVQLKKALAEIASGTRREVPARADCLPGMLTSAGIGLQWRVFQAFQQDETNSRSLAALRHGYLTLCLDLESHPASSAEAALFAHSRNGANRWFHASLQIVVFGNGRACVIANPGAALSGNVMVRAAGEIQRRAKQCCASDDPGGQAAAPLATQELKWNIDAQLIAQARGEIATLLHSEQPTFDIQGPWKQYFSARGLAPVNVFVVALQMALKRLTGRMPVIGQFLSMSRYRYLTFKTADVTTAEVAEFVHQVDGSRAGSGDPLAMLQQALDSQSRSCREVRREIDFHWAWGLFLMHISRGGARWRLAAMVHRLASLLCRSLQGSNRDREVLISHPAVDPDVALIGRPGVRYPFIKDLTLHYQIHPDRITVTVAPSATWNISSDALAAALTGSLERIRAVVDETRSEASAIAAAGVSA